MSELYERFKNSIIYQELQNNVVQELTFTLEASLDVFLQRESIQIIKSMDALALESVEDVFVKKYLESYEFSSINQSVEEAVSSEHVIEKVIDALQRMSAHYNDPDLKPFNKDSPKKEECKREHSSDDDHNSSKKMKPSDSAEQLYPIGYQVAAFLPGQEIKQCLVVKIKSFNSSLNQYTVVDADESVKGNTSWRVPVSDMYDFQAIENYKVGDEIMALYVLPSLGTMSTEFYKAKVTRKFKAYVNIEYEDGEKGKLLTTQVFKI